MTFLFEPVLKYIKEECSGMNAKSKSRNVRNRERFVNMVDFNSSGNIISRDAAVYV